MRAVLALCVLAAATGCRDDDQASEAAPAPPPPTHFGLEVDPGDRSVVATVDGRPVYGDCVARQAAAHGLDRRAALDECIGFELLAAEAERRGYLEDADVQEAGKREAVRALIDADYQVDEPADLPEDVVRDAWRRFEGVINRPELRTTYFCRAELDSDTPDDSAEERAARAKLRALHQRLAGRTLTVEQFRAACVEVVGDQEAAERLGLQHSPVQLIRAVRDDGSPQRVENAGNVLDEDYADAAYAIAKEGQVSPPVRLKWGWHVLYVREIAPAVDLSYEEAEPKLRERLFAEDSVRRTLFMRWAKPFGDGLDIEVFPERIPEPDTPLSMAGESRP